MNDNFTEVAGGEDVYGIGWGIAAAHRTGIGGELHVRIGGQLAVLDGTEREKFAAAVASAMQYWRKCCDHCNNSSTEGHDYVPGASPHDGPCEQCAAERARREHDEGTG